MPELIRPTVAFHTSYLAALDEFRAEGRLGDDDSTDLAFEVIDVPAAENALGFERCVATLRDRSREEALRPDGWVPDTLLWYVDGAEWLGRLDIRHRLTPTLVQRGGHIGYDVRPSSRLRGYATAMLRDALPIAAGLGINRVLVTCRVANIGSRKVIEKNGGVLEDERKGTLRFWVPTN